MVKNHLRESRERENQLESSDPEEQDPVRQLGEHSFDCTYNELMSVY
jgi:hypothetical protein